jgi:hypothetical protein
MQNYILNAWELCKQVEAGDIKIVKCYENPYINVAQIINKIMSYRHVPKLSDEQVSKIEQLMIRVCIIMPIIHFKDSKGREFTQVLPAELQQVIDAVSQL